MFLKHCTFIFASTMLLTACLAGSYKMWKLEPNAKYIEVDGKTYKVSKFVNQVGGYHSVPTNVPIVGLGVPLDVVPNNVKAIVIASGCSVDPSSVQSDGYHTRTLVICD